MYSHRFEVSIGDKPCGSCLLSKCEVVVDCLRGKVDNDRIRPTKPSLLSLDNGYNKKVVKSAREKKFYLYPKLPTQ